MNRESLDRSLQRLGLAAELHLPDVFVEFELALAVKRFGVLKVLRRVFHQRRLDASLRRKSKREAQ